LELLTYLDSYLAKQDRSVNTKVEGEGRYRTGLGIYYFEEALPHTEELEPGSKTDVLNRKGVEK